MYLAWLYPFIRRIPSTPRKYVFDVISVSQRSSPWTCNSSESRDKISPPVQAPFSCTTYVATNAFTKVFESVEAKYWVPWLSFDVQQAPWIRATCIKTALNSSFCTVIADSKSRWPHGKKHISAVSIPSPVSRFPCSWDSFDRIGGGPDTFKTPVVLSPDGINSWNSPAIFHSLCDMDVTYFPFDVQKCKLKFGSWTLSTAELIMEVENYTTNPSENYLKNGEWELIRADFSKKIVQYAVGAYQDLTLTIEISRNYYTYFINLVIPCALISAMIFLSFLLPPECGERISLGITVLLAMTVFQQLTQQLFPSFDIPLLGQYYIATSVEIGLALVATTMVLNFKFRRATKMSGWLRRLLLVHLAWLVGLKETIDKTCPEMKGKAPRHDKRGQVHLEKKRKAAQQLQDVLNGCRRRTDAASYDVSIETDETVEQNGHCGRFDARTFTPREGNVDCANSAEAPGTLGGNELEPSDDELAVRQWEWNMAANVLDRFLLALSVIVGVGTFFSIFLQAPRVRSFFTWRVRRDRAGGGAGEMDRSAAPHPPSPLVLGNLVHS